MRFQKIYLLSVVAMAAACSPKYYSPNTQNVPMITEQGQTSLQVSGNDNVVEFQGAYGVSEKFAVQANGALYVPKDENGNGGSGSFLEGGFGYYKTVGTNFIFETYGLVGYGKFENHFPGTVQDYPETNGKISANLIRYGIQPSFGYFSRYFSAAISTRFVGLGYSNIDGSLMYGNENQQAYLAQRRGSFLIEPAITVRAGLERVKLQLQLGTSINTTHSDFKQDNGYLTLGLHFRFGSSAN